MMVEIPGEGDENIIYLDVVRRNFQARRVYQECAHSKIRIDTSLSEIICKDCGEKINPVEWLANFVEEWVRITRKLEDLNEAQKNLDARSSVLCRNCSKMIKIRV
jgi:hypothetical protein